jgi:hypothetical protein
VLYPSCEFVDRIIVPAVATIHEFTRKVTKNPGFIETLIAERRSGERPESGSGLRSVRFYDSPETRRDVYATNENRTDRRPDPCCLP